MQHQEDRRRSLFSEANRARSKGKLLRAVALYRELLCEEPGDLDVILRLAPLLAHEGEHFEAWSLYRQACKALLAAGRHEACLAAFREANRVLPFEFEAWRLTSELERKLGRDREAFETLLEGRRQFRTRFVRAQAAALLKLAREIHPWDHGVVIDLAHLFIQTGQLGQALRLLDGALVHAAPEDLAEVRWAQFQATKSWRHLGLWLRLRVESVLHRTRERADPRTIRDGPGEPEVFARTP
jgi:tetratricopeptide (TPR) repeat protein